MQKLQQMQAIQEMNGQGQQQQNQQAMRNAQISQQQRALQIMTSKSFTTLMGNEAQKYGGNHLLIPQQTKKMLMNVARRHAMTQFQKLQQQRAAGAAGQFPNQNQMMLPKMQMQQQAQKPRQPQNQQSQVMTTVQVNKQHTDGSALTCFTTLTEDRSINERHILLCAIVTKEVLGRSKVPSLALLRHKTDRKHRRWGERHQQASIFKVTGKARLAGSGVNERAVISEKQGYTAPDSQFDLDFSTLKNAHVLKNFDFDSFLNTSADDGYKFVLPHNHIP